MLEEVGNKYPDLRDAAQALLEQVAPQHGPLLEELLPIGVAYDRINTSREFRGIPDMYYFRIHSPRGTTREPALRIPWLYRGHPSQRVLVCTHAFRKRGDEIPERQRRKAKAIRARFQADEAAGLNRIVPL